MTSQEISQLALGTKVYLVKDGEISSFDTLGFNAKYETYFYLVSTANVTTTKCLWLGEKSTDNNLFWETDYEKAKEEMWRQLQEHVKSINEIYFKGEK